MPVLLSLVLTPVLALLPGRPDAGLPANPSAHPMQVPDPEDPMLVIVDRSEPAYTVFLAVEEDAPEEEVEQLRSRVAQSEDAELLTWTVFRNEQGRYLDSRIVIDDYPGSRVTEGMVELLRRYARTPFGLTWNGGVAVTFNDYQHAKRGYETHLSDPDEYAATRVHDPARDPNHPRAHFRALLGWE